MQIQENISLAPHTTFRLGGSARYFATLMEASAVFDVFTAAEERGVPVFWLGSGSNTIFADGVIDKLVVKNELKGISYQDSGTDVLAKVAAGEDWDDLVADTVNRGFSGIEALSGIPGTVGAAPVQNIGAYGAELADVLMSVTAWDKDTEKFRELSPEECEFAYRDSLFKHQPGRFVITEVTLRLSDQAPAVPEYASLTKYLEQENIVDPDLSAIRQAVLAVRATRLPDVEVNPNAGSFFTNPIIPAAQAAKLIEEFPDLVSYELGEDRVKIPAGWLIERVGLRGKQYGNFRTSADNALVLIHEGKGTTKELISVQEEIKGKVKEMFGITLEREPNLVM